MPLFGEREHFGGTRITSQTRSDGRNGMVAQEKPMPVMRAPAEVVVKNNIFLTVVTFVALAVLMMDCQ